VASAILGGTLLAFHRAREMGLERKVVADLVLWTTIPGFVVSHWFEAVFYTPREVLERPAVLLEVWGGMSSFGGFIGAGLGGAFCLWRRRVPPWPYLDALVYAFVAAWILGRTGCAIAFDHPGHLTDFLLAMPYPGGRTTPGIRHNLGLYEVPFSIALFAFFFVTRRRPRPPGWYVVVTILTYMPFRFLLDFLRAADARYAALTAGQWASLAFVGFALWLRTRVVARGRAF
jgi:phosphatidylglycerol:prolipoprotein diacylglycerol transferase